MANIPTNDQYQNTGSPVLKIPKNFKYVAPYTPPTNYINLGKMNDRSTVFAPSPVATPGSFEDYESKQANAIKTGNLGQGVPTATQFMTPEDMKATTPIPSDYGTFATPNTIQKNGVNLSWGTPTTPVIKNLQGDVAGQYVEDTSNPNLLVKTIRGENELADKSILHGRSNSMYQIDHIIPLALGGADTLANRQLLTYSQNDQKTKAQAIPYTLYAYGDISLSEARAMAMSWKDKTVTDLPQPDSFGMIPDSRNRTGLQIARDTVEMWKKPKPVTFKDLMAGIPEATKNLGEGVLPDPVREFVKGFGSGATMGFLPYEQDDNETKGSLVAGRVGQILGSVASFMYGGVILKGAAKAVMGTYKGAAGLMAAKNGFKVAQTAEEIAQGLKTAETAKAVKPLFNTKFFDPNKSLNTVPGLAQRIFTPERVQQAGKMAATSAFVGQMNQFIANKFNPDILAGKTLATEQEGTMGNIFRDLAVGAISGVGSPTIKGTAYAAALPFTLAYLENPDDPMNAITDGVVFGVMHGMSSYKNPGFNDVKALGGKEYGGNILKTFEDTANNRAYNSLSLYTPTPEFAKVLKEGEIVPRIAHTPEVVSNAVSKGIEGVWRTYFYGKDASPEVKTETLKKFKDYSTELTGKLDTMEEIPKLAGLDRFSLKARQERNKVIKEQDSYIKKTYGKDYNIKPESVGLGEGTQLPGTGMSLGDALTEVKRLTIAGRQLYKGGLSSELRNKADIDDLLSTSKDNLTGRSEAMKTAVERSINPPIVQQTVDLLSENFVPGKDFRTNSLYDEAPSGAKAGDLPTGKIVLTGAGLDTNNKIVKYFMDQYQLGNASPNIILLNRPEMAPLWNMKNKVTSEADIAAGKYAIDPHPELSAEAFGVLYKKNATGGYDREVIDLGWVASDHRLNQATHPEHLAINKNPLIAEGKIKAIDPDNHKDTIVGAMNKEGTDVLVVNLDALSTAETVQSKKPWVVVNVNNKNWERAIQLKDQLAQQPNVHSTAANISKLNTTKSIDESAKVIEALNKDKAVPTGSDMVKEVPVNPEIPNNRIVPPKSATETIFKKIETSISAKSAPELQDAFKKNFGINITEADAQALFAKKDTLTKREALSFFINSVNKYGSNPATKMEYSLMKTFIDNGLLNQSRWGKRGLDTNLFGGMKPKAEPLPVVNPVTAPEATPVVNPITAPEVIKQEAVTPSAVIPTTTSPTLADKIVAKKKEFTPVTDQEANKIISDIDKKLALEKKIEEYDKENWQNELISQNAEKIKNPEQGTVRMSDEKMLPVTDLELPPTQKSILMQKIAKFDTKGRDNLGLLNKMDISGKEAEVFPDNWRSILAEPTGESPYALARAEEVLRDLRPNKKEVIPGPSIHSRNFIRNIDSGIKEGPSSLKYWSAKAWDTGMETYFGKGWKTNKDAARFISSMSDEGSAMWKYLNSETNYAGREIQQPNDYVKNMALGDRVAAQKAFTERRKIEEDYQKTNPDTGNDNTKLSDADKIRIAKKMGGNTDESGSFNMNVRPNYQEENMTGNLTNAENLMSGVSSELAMTPSIVVRDIRNLFFGAGKGTSGIHEFINDFLSKQNKSKKFVQFEAKDGRKGVFDDLFKEAEVADKKIEEVKGTKIAQKEEATKELPVLKKELLNVTRDIQETDRPAWQTDALLKEKLKEITDNIAKYSKIIEESDAAGGPGFHDGKGGMGTVAKNVGGFISDKWSGLKGMLDNSVYYNVNDPIKPVNSYKIREEDISGDIPYMLLSEIGNIPGTIQDQTSNVIHTGINRLKTNPKQYGSTLSDVLLQPGQYQGYAPNGINRKGKIVKSPFQIAKERDLQGTLDAPTQQKLDTIRDTLAQLKQKSDSGSYQDSTGGAIFYVHASDGQMFAGKDQQTIFKQANEYEKKKKIKVTKWGKQSGMPA